MSTPYYDDKLGMVYVKWAEGTEPAPHCKNCLRSADVLCDYPVGNDKTCDALLCQNHSTALANDIHYCESHFKEYKAFMDSGDFPNVLLFKRGNL